MEAITQSMITVCTQQTKELPVSTSTLLRRQQGGMYKKRALQLAPTYITAYNLFIGTLSPLWPRTMELGLLTSLRGSSHPEVWKEAWEVQAMVLKKTSKAGGGGDRRRELSCGLTANSGHATLPSQVTWGSKQMISMEKAVKGKVVSFSQAHHSTPGILSVSSKAKQNLAAAKYSSQNFSTTSLKICLTSLVITEMQIKVVMRYPLQTD